MLSNQQFDRTRRLALNLAGIELVERHRELFSRRSSRAGIRDGSGLDALLCAAERGEAAAVQLLLRLLTTKFTSFFRHASQFSAAAERAFHAAQRRGIARIWTAAAATGEEPYSLGMALIEAFQRDDPPVSILDTDIDTDALAIAERGEYSESALQGLSVPHRERFLGEADTPGRFVVKASLRRLVEFRALNLAGAAWPVVGPFDVIFCRNVLMYLETTRRAAAVGRMASLLAPDGLLMIDPVENLTGSEGLFDSVGDGIHAPRRASDRAHNGPRHFHQFHP